MRKKDITTLDVHQALFSSIREMIIKAKTLAYKSTNAFLLNMYWEIGRLIINDQQAGQVKAAYGKGVLKNLSAQLSLEFGAGFMSEISIICVHFIWHSQFGTQCVPN